MRPELIRQNNKMNGTQRDDGSYGYVLYYHYYKDGEHVTRCIKVVIASDNHACIILSHSKHPAQPQSKNNKL